MTLHEAQAQYALGLITASQYGKYLKGAIETAVNQKDLIEIFWLVIKWEESFKDKDTAKEAAKIASNCHLAACAAFNNNPHAPAYLQKIIYPLARYRPLPENLGKLYPRDSK